MTEIQGKQLIILAARANYLGDLRERKRISEEEYFARLNDLRQQAGLEPLRLAQPTAHCPTLASVVWGT